MIRGDGFCAHDVGDDSRRTGGAGEKPSNNRSKAAPWKFGRLGACAPSETVVFVTCFVKRHREIPGGGASWLGPSVDMIEGSAMKDIKDFCENDRFAKLAGVELLEVSKGRARARMEIRDHHLNAVDIVHGAAIFTLADLVFAMASNSYGTVAVAVNVSISYLKAASGGVLFAEATEVSRNSKLASYTIRVTDESDDLIAIFQGMVYRKKDKLPCE